MRFAAWLATAALVGYVGARLLTSPEWPLGAIVLAVWIAAAAYGEA